MSRPPLAQQLDLRPHPEGGWFRETWREESRWHVVRSAELWLWHRGGPLALRLGGAGDRPAATVERHLLGPDLAAGERPQLLVPGGVWQAAAPAGAEPVLVTCVVAPGFDEADFRLL